MLPPPIASHISHSTIGLVKGVGGDKLDGWKQIFEGGLKPFVEA